MKKVNKKCVECSKITGIIWKRQVKPDCYERVKCGHMRSYYRNHEINKKRQIVNHRYLRYKGDKCALCFIKESLEVHHIMPQCKGGLDARFNVITLCKKCHKTVTSYYRAIGWS